MLLGRISQVVRNMEEREAELEAATGEAQGRALAAEDEARRLREWAQSQLAPRTGPQLARLSAENSRLTALVERLERDLAAERAAQRPSGLTEFLAGLVPRPGCLVLIVVGSAWILTMIILLNSIFNSCPQPEDMLGR